VALGASTNERLIPGSSHAFTFKTMADALVLRNHLAEARAAHEHGADAQFAVDEMIQSDIVTCSA